MNFNEEEPQEKAFQLSIKFKYHRRKGQRVRKALDCKVIKSPRFKSVTGYSKRHKMTGTKISLEVDEKGGVDGIVISKGNIHDRTLAEQTNLDSLSNGAKKAFSLTADKGYDDGDYRKWLRSKKIRHAIPQGKYEERKRRRGRPFGCNKDYYEVRYVIERTNGWVEGFRRLKFRYERKFTNFIGMVLLASTLMNVRLCK
ncbi:MAG: transposase [Candidatus Cloacimonetes bacterium]|nr:transposase [Candidatus Cloacimonadota bacterium]